MHMPDTAEDKVDSTQISDECDAFLLKNTLMI